MITDDLLMMDSWPAIAAVLHLYDQHGAAIHRYASRLLVEPAAADRLTLRVFVRVARSAQLPPPDWAGRLWLYRVAAQQAQGPLHRQWLRCHLPGLQPALPATAARPLWAALLRLPPALHQPVILRTSENLRPAMIAEILDLPLPRVQVRLVAARQRLARALARA